MRKLGLIGGMSWVSTRTYYEAINKAIQAARGPVASAPLLVESLDFTDLVRLSSDDEWDRAAAILCDSARRLETAGATALIIGANSMHRVFDAVAGAVQVPVIHIADCIGKRMQAAGAGPAALIGTRNVMVEEWYRQRLEAHGVRLLPPAMDHVAAAERAIYDELMLGRATRNAERLFKTQITEMGKAGARAIVLGCTELEMVIDVDANVLPIYDSTRIHARAAADWILATE